MKLSQNAKVLLKARYLEKGETPEQMFTRVAKAVAAPDKRYGIAEKSEKEFYNMMVSLDFLPNSPTLFNAGRMGQLSACFVLPVEDDMTSIFETLKHMALIHKSGGGTGFSFSRLRPRGDYISSTGGQSSGPVSFMKIYDAATTEIKQGGKRRGANMGVLRVDHPDIEEFIDTDLQNFNISVGITNKFMNAVAKGLEYDLVNPRTAKIAGKRDASKILDRICKRAWQTGNPGMLFLDTINQDGEMVEATNPCGEVPLLPYEACTLGSINLANFVKEKVVDYEHLKKTVWKAVHFLDNTIDASKYPLSQTEKMVKKNRKIGLGVMGYADMLVKLGMDYSESERFAEDLMRFINEEAKKASLDLGKRRGGYSRSKLRNKTRTAIAPTGSISIIAGCSSGIEPIFAQRYSRMIDGKRIVEKRQTKGAYAHDVPAQVHVKVQAAFQRHTDNAVSKTVNLPNKATVADVKKVFVLAYELGCKGVTVYRDKSREQVLCECQ